jgi:hypothetical protein
MHKSHECESKILKRKYDSKEFESVSLGDLSLIVFNMKRGNVAQKKWATTAHFYQLN